MTEKKILIVDYDPQSLDALTKLLRSPRIHIIQATDGQMAYEKFAAEKPDLVILEAILPKIHGFDLTKRITRESAGRVPVIIVTGLYRGPQYRHEAINVFGASEYFEKPVDAERFVNAVRQLIQEEEDIDEALPDSNAIIESLSRLGKGRSKAVDPSEEKGRRP